MSNPKPINILLVGLGAIGSVYARVLEASGRAKVTAVARSNYELYSTTGVTLQTEKWGTFENWKPHRVVRSQAEALQGDVHYDYCFLTTKALPDITPAAELLAEVIQSKKVGAWAIMQNGVGVDEELYQAVKHLDTPIVSSAVWIGCNFSADGRTILQRGAWCVVCAGNYPPPPKGGAASPREQEALNTFVSLLKEGDGTVYTENDMNQIRYSKNVVNCAWGSFQTLARSLPVAWADLDPSVSQPLRDTVREIVDLGYDTGLLHEDLIAYPSTTRMGTREQFADAVWSTVLNMSVANAKKPGGGHRFTMWVDADAGRPIEVEVIVGAVARIAREHNIKTPRIDLMYALLKGLQVSLVTQQKKS